MTSIDEMTSAGLQSPLAADLAAGLGAISQQQTIQFTKYLRVVLPIDGSVFWVRADLAGPSALLNRSPLSVFAPNQAPVEAAAAFITAPGSLHYAASTVQREEDTYTSNRIVFTSLVEVDEFRDIGPNVLYLGTFDGVRFAFSQRGNLYRPQAGLFHYVGNAVYSDMATQIVDDPLTLNTREPVVSDSLPIWLMLNGYVAPYGFSNPGVTLYPSFLVPSNLTPPFVAVHCQDPQALAGAAVLGETLSSRQLTQERVRLTTYGLRNGQVNDLLQCILQFTMDYPDLMGVMNMPIVRDDKQPQPELYVIAQRKTIELDVNYYQARARDVARQLILSAVPTYNPGELIAA